MTEVFKQWKDQVLMKITADLPGGKSIKTDKQFVTSPNNLVVVNTREYTPIHGFGSGEWNVGHASRAPEYTWTLELPVTSEHVELFRAFQISRLPFTMESGAKDVFDDSSNASVYEPNIEKWEYCYVTSCNKNIVQNSTEVPTYTIEGVAYRHTYKTNGSTALNSYLEFLGSGVTEAGGSNLDRATTFTHIDSEDRSIWTSSTEE